MPIKRPKWDEIDEHERGWSMQDRESYEKSCREGDEYYEKLRSTMPKEEFLRFVEDMGLEWIDD